MKNNNKILIENSDFMVLVCFRQMQQILDDKSPPVEGEAKIAALTAGDRVRWGQTRQELFFKGPNRVALDTIEKSAFFVCLDDVPYRFDKNHPNYLDEYGRILLHGKGYDRWFDKSFTLCIGTNGKVRFHEKFKKKQY